MVTILRVFINIFYFNKMIKNPYLQYSFTTGPRHLIFTAVFSYDIFEFDIESFIFTLIYFAHSSKWGIF